MRTRYIRYVHGHVGAAQLAISDLRVFGNAEAQPPAAPRGVSVERDTIAAMRRCLEAGSGRGGIQRALGPASGSLDLSYQVFAERGTTLELRALNIDPAYEFAVEAFNEVGVSGLSAVRPAECLPFSPATAEGGPPPLTYGWNERQSCAAKPIGLWERADSQMLKHFASSMPKVI